MKINDLMIKAVQAKIAYWDATDAVEKAIAAERGEEDPTDSQVNAIFDEVEGLATCNIERLCDADIAEALDRVRAA